MQNILRLGVHDDFLAVNVHIAVGGAGGGLGCALGDALQLFALGIGHQTLASLGGYEVGRLLAAVGQIALAVQRSEVAGGSASDLIGLAGNVHFLRGGDIQTVVLQGQSVARSSGNIDLDIHLIASDGNGGGSILADGLSLVGIHQRSHAQERVGAGVRILALDGQHHDGLAVQLGVCSAGVGRSIELELGHEGGLGLVEEQLRGEVNGESSSAALVGRGVEVHGVAVNAKRLDSSVGCGLHRGKGVLLDESLLDLSGQVADGGLGRNLLRHNSVLLKIISAYQRFPAAFLPRRAGLHSS